MTSRLGGRLSALLCIFCLSAVSLGSPKEDIAEDMSSAKKGNRQEAISRAVAKLVRADMREYFGEFGQEIPESLSVKTHLNRQQRDSILKVVVDMGPGFPDSVLRNVRWRIRRMFKDKGYDIGDAEDDAFEELAGVHDRLPTIRVAVVSTGSASINSQTREVLIFAALLSLPFFFFFIGMAVRWRFRLWWSRRYPALAVTSATSDWDPAPREAPFPGIPQSSMPPRTYAGLTVEDLEAKLARMPLEKSLRFLGTLPTTERDDALKALGVTKAIRTRLGKELGDLASSTPG